MICFHHIDIDGYSSGRIVYEHIPNRDEARFIPISYPEKFPLEEIKDKEDVYLVDISFGEDTFNQLKSVCAKAKNVTWIDHHKTSVDLIKDHKEEIDKLFNLNYFVNSCGCGAVLTHLHFYYDQLDNLEFDKETKMFYDKTLTSDPLWVPEWLLFLDDHDCWKKLYYPTTDHIILGIEAITYEIKSTFWDDLKNDKMYLKRLELDGRNIKRYLDAKYTKDRISGKYETLIDGNKAIVMNSRGNSWVFGDEINNYPITCLWDYNGDDGKYSYSIYTNLEKFPNVDCSEIAAKFGGGGHKGASGFSSDYLLFKPIERLYSFNPKVFLGGTVDDSWREEFLKMYSGKYFNPIVPDWTPECVKIEDEEKAKSLMHLYVITPNMKGVYSIAEIMDSAMNHRGYTIVCILRSSGEKAFDARQFRSLTEVAHLAKKYGASTCDSLATAAEICTMLYNSVRIKNNE